MGYGNSALFCSYMMSSFWGLIFGYKKREFGIVFYMENIAEVVKLILGF